MPENNERTPPEYTFIRYWVDYIHFQTNEPELRAPGEQRPQKVLSEINFRLATGINTETRIGQLTLVTGVVGDPKWQPYLVEVSITGQFGNPGNTATQTEFEAFMQKNVPVILFPYVREIIERTTAEGRFDRVRIQPMNLVAALPSEWQPATPSSVPSQPSEQSPDASQG